MFRVNEVKKWASAKGITVKKSGEGYIWFAEGESPSEPAEIDYVVRQVFNKMTDNKWVEYQKSVSMGLH